MIEQRVYKQLEEICKKCGYGFRCFQCDFNKSWLFIKDPENSLEAKQKVAREVFSTNESKIRL